MGGGLPTIAERKGNGYTKQAGAEAEGSATITKGESRDYTNK